ncbi:tRNA lysidine(34) synthetase TilS [Amantichitinum ursilacus]|uniref:tRNA(Ile)-lysidine synthase n=1 Tax=Amantichitinum ursilacus TaxID=857265 RepID=A0A0N0GNK6_9NEIS|nr:tRNA lysidine(34) synthetase TilS [Amantichitinum ursilacus]KPC52944.1 tRNA(Ile)-lysidine synthase [Amantichitinum ursilacus]
MANSRKSTSPEHDVSAQLLQTVWQRLAPLLDPSTTVCVGLSGGVDSVVLLHLLARCAQAASGTIPLRLSAVHVHHGLSPHADAWAAFAVDYAARLGVHCAVERISLAGRAELGVEAAARNARYAAFLRQPAQIFAVGHHRDDQAETILLSLLRGSGVNGLASMPFARPLSSTATLVRPLLDTPRAALLRYAEANQLAWIEDESNLSTDYERNALRHQVLPPLRAQFGDVDAAMARSARHLGEASQLLDELAAEDLARCVQDGAFELATPLSPLRLKHALRYWLAQSGLVLDTRAFDELWRVMSDAAGDAQPALVWRQEAVRRYRTRLWITPAVVEPGPNVALQGVAAQTVPYWQGMLAWQQQASGQGIALHWLERGYEVRAWQGSARLRLRADGPAQQLKTLAQSRGMPPWVRAGRPGIYIDDQLAAFSGLGVDHRFVAAADEPGWLPLWQPGPAISR